MRVSKLTIAVDAMGGDYGSQVVIPGVAIGLSLCPDLHVILVGDTQILTQCLKQNRLDKDSRITIEHASEVVAMDELPQAALRNKKNSSMRVAIELVKTERAQACMSAGNTGALMAIARFVLKTIPGIDRPAIISPMPTMQQGVEAQLLDSGANVDSSPEQLCQFALMGSVYASVAMNIARPRVALLNVGVEDIKGNEVVRATAQLLTKYGNVLNYIGYVEGDDMYEGVAEVIVCDGFVGNVALKSCEGTARLLLTSLKEEFLRTWWGRLSGLLAKPVFARTMKRMDPTYYNGAGFIGLQGLVVKSHGGASARGIATALQRTYLHAQKNLPQLISAKIKETLQAEVAH
jgi:phosphate acyltransferase